MASGGSSINPLGNKTAGIKLYPLQLDKILEAIFGFLSVKELKTCRQVNHLWNLEGIRRLGKVCSDRVNIRSVDGINEFTRISEEKGKEWFNFPFNTTSFHVDLSLVERPSHENALAIFLMHVGSTVTQLKFRINYKTFLYGNGARMLEGHQFPKLEVLQLDYPYCSWGTNNTSYFTFLTNIMKSSPNLRTLTLVAPPAGVNEFVSILQNVQLSGITTFLAPFTWFLGDPFSLFTSDWKLEKCEACINVYSNDDFGSLVRFLEIQSGNLIEFDVRVNQWTGLNSHNAIMVPRMTCLESISMTESFFKDIFIRFPESFPVVRSVCFKDDSWKLLPIPEYHRIRMVKELDIQNYKLPTRDRPRPCTLVHTAWTFPNVKKLRVEIDDGMKIISDIEESFPDVVELEIKLRWCYESDQNTLIDRLITGLTREECENVELPSELTMDFQTTEEEFSRRALVPEYQPMSCLKSKNRFYNAKNSYFWLAVKQEIMKQNY